MEGFTEEELLALRTVAQALPPEHWHVTHDQLGAHIENGDGKGRIIMKVGQDRPDLGRDRRNLVEYFATFDPYTVRKLVYWFSVLSLRTSFDMEQENYAGTPASNALFRIAELADELRASEAEAAEQEARIDKALALATTEWKSQGIKAAVLPLIIKTLSGEVDE